MKVTIEFQLPEETEEHLDALKGSIYKYKLEGVWDKLFRPRHKHGYQNERLNTLLKSKQVNEAFDILEQMYLELKNEG